MLERIGLFDEMYFLYCEDTDLGLRARWAGWECLYVPQAAVEHRYSHTAGGASPMKAYYVERNRLYTALKNFPPRMLLRVPFAAAARYFWHLSLFARGLRQDRASIAGRTRRVAAAVSGFPRPRGYAVPAAAAMEKAEANRRSAQNIGRRFRSSREDACDLGEGGRVTVKLLVLIPAFNEEGAIGRRRPGGSRAMPGTPVLVVGRSFRRRDGRSRAKAPARASLHFRITWGSADACRRDIGWPTNSATIM